MNEKKSDKYKKVICPVCGNDVTVNTKFKYHNCLFCSCKIKLTFHKEKIIGVEENVSYTKKKTNIS